MISAMRNSRPRSVRCAGGKQRRAHRQLRGDGVAQIREVVALERRHRHAGAERVACGQLRQVRQQLRARAHLVELVDRGERRAAGARNARQRQLILAGPAQRLHHQHHEIGAFERRGGGAVHGLVQGTARLGVQARCVDEGDLRVRQVEDPEDAVAGGLGTRCDDAQLLPDQRVEQRRFADVGPTDQRGEAAAKLTRGRRRAHGSAPAAAPAIAASMRAAASCSALRRLAPPPSTRSFRPGTSQLTRKVWA